MSKKPKAEADKVEAEMEADMTNPATEFATKSFDQAEAVFNKAGEVAHENVQVLDAAASAIKARTADVQMKAMEFAQSNVNAVFTFARKAVAAKAPTDIFALNQEFARNQMEAFSKQMKEMNDLFVLLAKESARPVQDGIARSRSSFGKNFSA